MQDVVIIGAGVIGAMVARELSKYNLKVCLLEKENDVATGASKANSGIVHGGFDAETGTLKAKLNVLGVDLLYKAAKELNVPIKNNGSFVVAFSKEEEPALHELYNRGVANGVKGMSLITGDEARELEPELSKEITLCLNVPSAGIVCPYELTIAAVGNAMDNGVKLMRNFCVSGINKQDGVFTVTAENGQSIKAKYVINCAGGYSDKIAALAGNEFFSIIPRAGEYMLLDKKEGSRVSHTIFQVPTKEGKGILVSPTVDGNLLTGPTANKVESPNSSETTPVGLETVERFAKKSVPSVNFRQVITSFSGVRSSTAGGDFIICKDEKVDGLIHAAAIDSPGLSSCVAIAQYVVELLAQTDITLEKNTSFCGMREDPHNFRKMDASQKNEYIKSHPSYGKIVCRCEGVSEGEIIDAIKRNPGALDVDGVKRRTRSGMGRCQGGFCSPYVMKLIAEINNIKVEEVTKNGGKSYICDGKI